MYRLQTIIPMYTNAIATAKLIAVTNAMTPEGICLLLLLLRLTDFAAPAMLFSELAFVAAFFTGNGDDVSSLTVLYFVKSVLETRNSTIQIIYYIFITLANTNYLCDIM